MNQDIITPFAQTNFRNKKVAFGIKTDDRRRHMYAIGKTGMGKTNLLENLAIQDIRNGAGLCFIDPHGDTAEKLISMVPPDRVKDVIYFNPGDQDFPLSFNVMETVDPRFRPLVASGLIGVFQKLWADSWGPRLEYILRNAILALLEYPGSTLLGVMRILVDKKYRIEVINHVKDPVVRAFWVDEFSQWNERVLQEVISPIQNKVGQFLTSPLIRNVVGQSRSSFNVREAMDSEKIIILNLAKGRIGEDNSSLLGAMMVTKIQLAAMGRVDMEEDDRKDFYLYVDEFQNFATESFANILSEARKYRLSLILAHQYVAQLEDVVRDAVFGNVGSMVSFRVGAADAEALEKEFEPVFMMNDIVNLPKYKIYLKLMIDGVAGDAFSADTLPPISRLDNDSTDAVIQMSRDLYANDIDSVEKEIMDWSGMTMPGTVTSGTASTGGATPAVSAPNRPAETSPTPRTTPPTKGPGSLQKPQAPSTDKPREVFDAICADCGLAIQVPFKPDGSRPVFCKDCLKEVQRKRAKQEEERSSKSTQSPLPRPAQHQKKPVLQKSRPVSRTSQEVHVSQKPQPAVDHVKETVEPDGAPLLTPSTTKSVGSSRSDVPRNDISAPPTASIKDLIAQAQKEKK